MVTARSDVSDHGASDREEADWSTADAADLYRIGSWSDGFFGVSARGHMTVRPFVDEKKARADLKSRTADKRIELASPRRQTAVVEAKAVEEI